MTTASTTTTTPSFSNADILILNTWHSFVPVITNASGKEDRDINFTKDDNVGVEAACSVTWRGEHFVFGGRYDRNLIAKIIGCQLKKVGELPFYHYMGGCANMADNRVYVCFNYVSSNYDTSDYKKCYVASSPQGQFENTTQSFDGHTRTRIAASESK